MVFLTLTGSRLQSLFDYMGSIKPGEGAFPQVSDGVRFTLNFEKEKCENIRINGRPIDPLKTYGIVTNSYLAKGGDGYGIFLEAIDQFDASTFQRDALIAYIKHLGGDIAPEVKKRITLLP